MADWLPQRLQGYRSKNLGAALFLHYTHPSFFPSSVWSPCPSCICWGFRLSMDPDGEQGIWQRHIIKAESWCTGINWGWGGSMGFWRSKLWMSQWFRASWNPIVVLRIVPRGLLKQIHSPLLITGGELITREAAAHTVSMWSCLQRHDRDCVGVL